MPDLNLRTLDLATSIQQIPAPTHQEAKRAEFVRRLFVEEGLVDVGMDAVGNVLARLPGKVGGKPVIISAHLDTVFPLDTDLKLFREPGRICGPGIGDNSLGVAGLFGLVWALRESQAALSGDLWLAANVCEEGLGNLRGMKALVEQFAHLPQAYIVLEGMSLGQVYHRALGVRRLRIRVSTPGGHSWIDYGKPSAIHELTALAVRITALKLPETPRTSLNVGTISGGTSVNTIAAEASFDLDLRSEDARALELVAGQVDALVQAVRRTSVEVAAEVIGQRPAGELPTEAPLVVQAQASLRAVGLEPQLKIGSTDANLPLSLGMPAVTIGLTTGRGGHTLQEYINTEPLSKGLEQLVRLVTSLMG